MPTDPRVDAYIAAAADFARPILSRLRDIFHSADPRLVETIKWGVPYFEHKGLVGGMAAFKKHVAFGFWKPTAMDDPLGILGTSKDGSMCSVKVARLEDLPPAAALKKYVRAAVELNERGVKAPPSDRTKARRALEVPDDFGVALATAPKAVRTTWNAFPPSHRHEYLEWILEAKRPDTRARRIAQAIELIAEGKSKNWKYQKC